VADLPLLILLDQNVPRLVVPWLEQLQPNWRVVHTSELGLSGATDSAVLEWAQDRGAIVVTFDEDLADQRAFPVGSHCGVIRLRIWPTTIEATQRALERLLGTIDSDEDLPGALIVVGQDRIRIRRAETRESG